MKVFAFAIVSAAMTVAVVHAATCDTASVTALLTSDEVATCTSDSGYSPSSLTTPTDSELGVMCTSTACQTVLSDLTTMFTEECTVGTFALYADLITPVTTYCSSTSSASMATSTSGSVSTNTASTTSSAAASTSASATAGSAAVLENTSSASLDSAEEVTVAPTNTTTSASSDDDVTVGDSDSGSDLTIETQAPASDSASATTDSSASSSSVADDTSSASSDGVAVSPSVTLLGSILVATAALFV